MQYLDLDMLRFQLYDVFGLEEVLNFPFYEDHDTESIDMFLGAIKDFCDKELYPYFKEMDEQPAHFKDGKVWVHPQVGKALKEGGDLGIMYAPFSTEKGGLQMPSMAVHAMIYMLDSANNHVPGYWGLTLGSANLIATFGNDELKAYYVDKMLSAEWGGTMCLTEPQAGSSLSDITTSASLQDDGSYAIKGQKIFISGGDHEYVDNIVHLVIARIDGAPKGTKGISLFVVPKNRSNGSGLESNDVITGGDFQKMGQRGYCTTHIIFGEQDDCKGWLVGEPNRGLRYMFQMMNEARIAVGRGAAAIAGAAYQASLHYAKERPQGRRIQDSGKKDVSKDQTLIINHADVRRMLLLQKCVVEGSLALVMQAARYIDLSETSNDAAVKEKYHLLLELLTPIVKTYPSEMGQVAVNNGLQVLGGYGFCSEYILQQYYRDIRISAIYEGTTGIQSIDLLGRKMTLADGKAAQLLIADIMETIGEASKYDSLKPYAQKMGGYLQKIQATFAHLGQFAAKGDFERYLSDATIFMEMFGTAVVGWQLLKIAAKAQESLVIGKTTYSNTFYESKIHLARFYFKYEMPKVGKCAAILENDEILTIAEETVGIF